jgi:hypothetical protein
LVQNLYGWCSNVSPPAGPFIVFPTLITNKAVRSSQGAPRSPVILRMKSGTRVQRTGHGRLGQNGRLARDGPFHLFDDDK